MTPFIAIVLVSVICVDGQESDDNSDDFCNVYLEYLSQQLNDFSSGKTFSITSLSTMISDSQLENDVYQLQFTSRINDLFHRQILIGQRNNMNQIISVQICFYGEDGEIIRDILGNPKEYTSNRHNLGHVLDMPSEEGLIFSYAKCRLQLQPNSNFYPDSLFFHLPQFSSTFQFN
ncbi:unnamed protein product, partial [Adineta steineri]